MKALKFGGIAILLVAASAYAIDGVVLKYVFKKDAVSKTRTKGTIEFNGGEITVTMVNQTKVREVAEDGTVTLEASVLEGKAITPQGDFDFPPTPGVVVVMKGTGEIKEIKGEDVSDATYRFQNLSSFIPTTEAIQVGSKWKKETPANKDTKAPAYKSEYTVLAEEKIDGVDTFKIQFKNSDGEGTDGSSIEGTMWVDKTNCDLIKGTQKWTNVTAPAAPVPVSGNFTLEKVK